MDIPTNTTTKTAVFGGLRYQKKHIVHSLRSARKWEEKYKSEGYQTKMFREKVGIYNVYIRRE